MKLFRLKSNRNTIVKQDGIFHKVVWSATMESHGIDSSWMAHQWNPLNVEELTKKETLEVNRKIKKFTARQELFFKEHKK